MQSLENSETISPINVLESRKRIDERALEKEEEDYFNEDRQVFYYFVNYLRVVFAFKHFSQLPLNGDVFDQ